MLKKTKKEVKEKDISIFTWLKQQCKDWKTFLILICVIIVLYIPVWGGYLLYFMFKWNWCLAMANFIIAFWAGPFTPFFPLAIAITLSIKKIMKVTKKK